MKKLLVALIIFTSLISVNPVEASDYGSHWARETIEYWLEEGYIDLDYKGNFYPDKYITRAEFVRIVNRAFDIHEGLAEVDFKDLSRTSNFYEDIGIAYKFGYIRGYKDGTFRPDQPIKRVEAASIIAEVLGIKEFYNRELDFLDRESIGSWGRPKLAFLVDKEAIIGYPDGNFRPNNLVTRAEAVTMLRKIHDLSSQGESLELRTVSNDGYFLESRIKLYDEKGQLILEDITDKDGYISLELEEGRYLILVESLDKTYSNLEEFRVRKGYRTFMDLILRKKILA